MEQILADAVAQLPEREILLQLLTTLIQDKTPISDIQLQLADCGVESPELIQVIRNNFYQQMPEKKKSGIKLISIDAPNSKVDRSKSIVSQKFASEEPASASAADVASESTHAESRGNWDCSCGAVNFPHRKDCFKCRLQKPAHGVGALRLHAKRSIQHAKSPYSNRTTSSAANNGFSTTSDTAPSRSSSVIVSPAVFASSPEMAVDPQFAMRQAVPVFCRYFESQMLTAVDMALIAQTFDVTLLIHLPLKASMIPCRFYPNCLNTACTFYHPSGVAGEGSAAVIGSENTLGEVPCRFQQHCTRPGCPYQHSITPASYVAPGGAGKNMVWKPKSATSERVFVAGDVAEQIVTTTGKSAEEVSKTEI
ncbi:MAG: hypothetical protein SGCHY_001540 [Lobulomycetales sp.]